MRSPLLLLLCLTLAGCAEYEARRQILDGHQPQYLAQLHDLTLAPYREWVREQPRDCRSPTLMDARASVLNTALMIKPERQGFEAAYDAASWILEVADGAGALGCKNVAIELYVKVGSIYTGVGYVRLREHASAAVERLGS